MNTSNKIKTGIALPPECIALMDRHMTDCGCYSRNELVQKAIEHFVTANLGRQYDDYFKNNNHSKTARAIKDIEDRLARIGYKIAVEVSQMNLLLTDGLDIDTQTVQRYRSEAASLVNQTKGIISLGDAVKRKSVPWTDSV